MAVRLQITATREEIEQSLFGPKTRKKPEGDIMRALLGYLNMLPMCWAWRQNVGGGKYKKEDGKTGYVRFGMKGMGDIAGMLHGIYFEIEVKRPGRRPDDHQQARLKLIRDQGGIAFWCDSLTMCAEKLERFYLRAQTRKRPSTLGLD